VLAGAREARGDGGANGATMDWAARMAVGEGGGMECGGIWLISARIRTFAWPKRFLLLLFSPIVQSKIGESPCQTSYTGLAGCTLMATASDKTTEKQELVEMASYREK
jgi:hypothetical protein